MRSVDYQTAPISPILIWVSDFYLIEVRVWGWFSLLALISIGRVLVWLCISFNFWWRQYIFPLIYIRETHAYTHSRHTAAVPPCRAHALNPARVSAPLRHTAAPPHDLAWVSGLLRPRPQRRRGGGTVGREEGKTRVFFLRKQIWIFRLYNRRHLLKPTKSIWWGDSAACQGLTLPYPTIALTNTLACSTLLCCVIGRTVGNCT